MELGNVADWVSAVGTISACAIALHLASRQARPTPMVSSTLWGYSETDELAAPSLIRAIDVEIANPGYLPFSVGLVLVIVGLGVRRVNPVEVRGSGPGGPVLLYHGESVRYTFSLKSLRAAVQSRLDSHPYGWILRRIRAPVRVLALLSSGEMIRAPLDRASLRALLSDNTEHLGDLHRKTQQPVYVKARMPTHPATKERDS